MALETTTIERTNTVSNGINFEVTVYEMKTTAFCDTCDATATATKKQLENRGWSFGKGCEFCPDCY